MKKPKHIVFFWKKIGKLKILLYGNQYTTMQFTPSVSAVMEGIARVEGRSQGRGTDEGNT